VPHVEELTRGQADHEARRRGGGNPALRVALSRGDGAGKARERDHASRTLERFEPTHDLRLLGREPLRRKRVSASIASS
jgi:hypothetical protein